MSEFNGERLQRLQTIVNEAAALVSGEGADPLEVFPDPKQEHRRGDIEWGSDLSESQSNELRDLVYRLGPGRPTSYGPVEAGLSDTDFVAVLEGGQPHKIKAQLNILTAAGVTRPGAIVMTGSTGRFLSDSEKSIGEKLIGQPIEGNTSEANMAEQLVAAYRGRTSRDRFYPFAERRLLDETDMYTLEGIGSIALTAVDLMGVHRVPTGEGDQFRQLTNAEKLVVASRTLGAKTLAFVTSATYQPSNEVQAYQAAKIVNADVHVLSYGTEELAKVKGETSYAPTLAQLAVEVYKTAATLKTVNENR